MGRIAPGLRDVYLTEYGSETNPPDGLRPFNPYQQARLLAWAESLAWRNPAVRTWPQFLLRDMGRIDSSGGRYEFADWQTGLRFVDGSPKPAVAAFRLGLHAECVPDPRGQAQRGRRRARRAHSRMVELWGRVRPDLGGQAFVLLLRGGAALPMPVVPDADGVFTRRLSWHEGTRYRLSVVGLNGVREEGIDVEPALCSARPSYLTRGLSRAVATGAGRVP